MVASDSIVDGCRYPPFRFDEVRGIFATTDPIPVLKLKEWRC